ncbi:MAG: hypothetical protein HZA11_10925 [Nitrospirae bacterium]|nr:hypothetical protein [Nitrospirota bacterium]
MKRKDIKKCAVCGKGVMHTGLPLFWAISVQRFGIDMSAVHKQAGLEMMLGSPVLASIMGPDEDLAKHVMEKIEVILCEECIDTRIPILIERLEEKRESEQERITR